ncbi:alpha/beta fold hydrolase [Fodinicola feengrottensis]|uniref:alpha/beta fold hydrolase n=1 Tax=Fodinicola feengrottensis TaxID=435914 RepID=UPI0036F3E554
MRTVSIWPPASARPPRPPLLAIVGRDFRTYACPLIIHGEADPMARLIAGVETAKAIPGARLVTYPGMGHDLPRELWPSMLDHLRELADSAVDA